MRILEKVNIEADYACSAEEALEIFENPGHCVVLTDVNLPGMSGLELLKTIKEN